MPHSAEADRRRGEQRCVRYDVIRCSAVQCRMECGEAQQQQQRQSSVCCSGAGVCVCVCISVCTCGWVDEMDGWMGRQ
jgi:hypothetical protein